MTADLAARLEATTWGDRELSDDVLRVCGWEFLSGPAIGAGVWKSTTWHNYLDGRQPDPTRSVDDAIELIPKGYTFLLLMHPPEAVERGFDPNRAEIYKTDPATGLLINNVAIAATPALALSAAIVKALNT